MKLLNWLRHILFPMSQSEFASMGGKARSAKLSPERRTEIARNAGLARQAKRRNGQ